MWRLIKGHFDYYKYTYLAAFLFHIAMVAFLIYRRELRLGDEQLTGIVIYSAVTAAILLGAMHGAYTEICKDKLDRFHTLLPLPVFQLSLVGLGVGLPIFLTGDTILLTILFVLLQDYITSHMLWKLLVIHGMIICVSMTIHSILNLSFGFEMRYVKRVDAKSFSQWIMPLLLVALLLPAMFYSAMKEFSGLDALAWNLLGLALYCATAVLSARRRSYLL